MSPKRFATTRVRHAVMAGMALLLPAVPCLGQARGHRIAEKPTPDHQNVTYGPHRRNVLDFWQAKSDKPTPLVLFIHGGAFIGGDKSQLSPATLKELLDAGISVAAVGLGQEAIEKDVVVEHLEPRRGKLLGEEVLAAAGLW